MMNEEIEVLFVGTGEAFCDERINTSIFIHSKYANILLDCGYSVPFTLARELKKRYGISLNNIDIIYISHFHGDHTLGLPPLLLRMKEEGRRKPIYIVGQQGIKRYLDILIGLSYKTLLDSENRGYEIKVSEVNTEENFVFNSDIKFAFAETNHSIRNLGVCIFIKEKKVLCYSGDGDVTSSALRLYDGASLLIHEAFGFETKKEGHAEILSLVNELKNLKGLKDVALIHIRRELRGKKIRNIMAFLDAINYIYNKNFFIPDDLQTFRI